MSFLIGPMIKRITGYKNLTDHNEIIKIKASDRVYFPLVLSGKELTLKVNINDRVKIGQVLAERNDHFYVPIFSSVSGTVENIEEFKDGGLIYKQLVVKNDYLDEFVEEEKLDYTSASKEEIIEFMKKKGLTGQGGAGFPTYFKYQTDKCETLVINAVECEPYITSDARMIQEYADYFKTGILAMLKASQAKKVLIGIKEYKKALIKQINELFVDYPNIELKAVKDAYPLGWEAGLIYQITKKRYNKLPIEIGMIVSNATTAICLAKSMETGYPIYEKMVTVSGNAVGKPANCICRVGTKASELLTVCGVNNDIDINVIMGGPMMGVAYENADVAITSISNAITVLKYKKVNPIPCLRCGDCVDYCPVGLQPCNINQAVVANDVMRISKLKAMDCIECGMCTYVCPSKIAVTQGIRDAKKVLREAKVQ